MIERYRDETMTGIWSTEATLHRWFRVEEANYHRIGKPHLAEAVGALGSPPEDWVREHEKKTRHDVVAFLYAMDEWLDQAFVTGDHRKEWRAEARQWLHYGLTSSDVVDSAQAMALSAATDRLLSLTEDLESSFQWLGELVGLTIGRTHGQYAAPVPASHRWEVLRGMVIRGRIVLEDVAKYDWWGKMSGPVGTNIEEQLHYQGLNQLRLTAIRSTQIVPRDQMIEWANAVVRLTDACEATATQVWLLAQEPIGEVVEGQAEDQVGSSAMPHKRNPVASENIRGLCRLARAYAQVLQGGLVQFNEHDLAHSSVERVALPDLCHVAATILFRTTVLVLNLQVRTTDPNSLAGYIDTHASLMELQERGMSYADAHRALVEDAYQDPYPDGKIPSDNPTREDA